MWLLLFSMFITGSLVGLVSSFFGVGACFIMVPAMIAFFESAFHVPPSLAPLIAFGTNMSVVVPTSLSGVLRHRRELKSKGLSFPTKHYLYFGIPVGIGSFIGALFAFTFFATHRATAGILLKGLFGIVCLIGAYRFMKAKPLPVSELNPPNVTKYSASGLFAAIFAHFIGIGGGIVYMPILNTLLKIPVHIAVPISLATMIIGSSVGAASFGILGYIDQIKHPQDYPPLSFGWFNLIAFLSLGIGSIIFAQIGPRLAHKTSPKKFKILLAIVYAYIGIRLIIRSIYQIQGLKPPIP